MQHSRLMAHPGSSAGFVRAASLWLLAAIFALLASAAPAKEDVSRFAGSFTGSSYVEQPDGSKLPRDMSVRIKETRHGFLVSWSTTTEKQDGRRKTKAFEIEFKPTSRSGIYSAAMAQNVFGHAVQLDPMKGEPYVWGRISGDTLTVFSMFVTPGGDYEMQQYDRTLVEGGLKLDFTSHRNGEPVRRVSTLLTRVE